MQGHVKAVGTGDNCIYYVCDTNAHNTSPAFIDMQLFYNVYTIRAYLITYGTTFLLAVFFRLILAIEMYVKIIYDNTYVQYN